MAGETPTEPRRNRISVPSAREGRRRTTAAERAPPRDPTAGPRRADASRGGATPSSSPPAAVGNQPRKARKSRAAVFAKRKSRAKTRRKDLPARAQTRSISPAAGSAGSPVESADRVETRAPPDADTAGEPRSSATTAPDRRPRKASKAPRKRRRPADKNARDESADARAEEPRGAEETAGDLAVTSGGRGRRSSTDAAAFPGRAAPAHWRRLAPNEAAAGGAPAAGSRPPPPRHSGLPIVPTLVPVRVFFASSGFSDQRPSAQHQRLCSDIAIAAKPDEDGDTALHIAVVQQNVQMVHRIVQLFHMGRISLDVYNHLHQSPLHLGIITGQEAVVATLLRGGASPTALDRHGMNAVHLACSAGQPRVLRLLLRHPACRALLDRHDFSGMTPLHVAVKETQASIVSCLLEIRVDVDALDWKNGASALIHAVENDNKEIVELLLTHGANVNLQTYGGNAAVHVASGRGLLEITQLLVRHGANLALKNAQNENAFTVTTSQQVINILKGKTAKPHVTGSGQVAAHSQQGGNSPNKPHDLPNAPAALSVLINQASQTDTPTSGSPPHQHSSVQDTGQPVDGSKQGAKSCASSKEEESVTEAPSIGVSTKSTGHGCETVQGVTAAVTQTPVRSSIDSSDEVKFKLQAAIRSRGATAGLKMTSSQPAQVVSPIVILRPVTIVKTVSTLSPSVSKAANASPTLTKTTAVLKESYISIAKEWLATAKVTPSLKCVNVTLPLQREHKQSSTDACSSAVPNDASTTQAT